MSSQALLYCCILIWGISTFLNRLSVERMSPLLMQVIVGIGYMFFIPIAFRMSSGAPLKWSVSSILLTSVATIISIAANVMLYAALKGNKNTGSSTMIVALYPVITMILSIVFLGEQLTVSKVIGVSAMIGGAILLSQ
ncbi:DMT family transporter [Flavobacterium sp.]|uniref:DMT family transporter n=1 Tax=Flavobacterium sp. TaxID=239 RepID=UPI003266FD62